MHVVFKQPHQVFSCRCLDSFAAQLGESLEEQLGQRLLRMPPPPQLPPRVRQGQQHTIEQQQQPSMFQLPYELPPVMTDPMQVGRLREGPPQQHVCSSSVATEPATCLCSWACHGPAGWVRNRLRPLLACTLPGDVPRLEVRGIAQQV